MRQVQLSHKIVLIIIAAVLTTIALMVLVRLDILGDASQSVTVDEHDGVYDLSALDMDAGIIAVLPPGAFYFPNIYLAPEDAVTTPERAGGYNELLPDYLSQRFILTLPGADSVYKVIFTGSGPHAYSVYINGELAGRTGQTGTTKQGTNLWVNNIVCYAASENGRMDIILHSAQFYRYGKGAGLAALTIEKAPLEPNVSFTSIDEGFIVIGALLCATVMLLCVFFLFHGTKATFYFALACAAMVLRECIKSKGWVKFPFITGNTAFMLEYMSLVLLTIFLTMYLAQTLTNRFARVLKWVSLGGSLLYGLCLLTTDSLFYTMALTYYQILLVGCIACGIPTLFWKLRRPNKEQSVALYGIAVFYLAAVSDILMYNGLFSSAFSKVSVSETAMLVFVLTQTISLFLTNNRLFAEAKESEHKLANEKEILEKLNRLKTEFLGNVSHEMRTPLSVISVNIQTASQLIKRMGDPAPDPEAVELLKDSQSEIMRLTRMVGGMLTLASFSESAKKSRTDLTELLESVADTLRLLLLNHSNKLETKIDAGLIVFGDADLLAQVAVNLIQNANAHTRNDVIKLRAVRDGGTITVTISDNGSGISPELLPSVFERGVSGKTGNGGGTGFGLFLCKTVVESHGGRIWIESEPGRGTAAGFTLPFYEGQFGGGAI